MHVIIIYYDKYIEYTFKKISKHNKHNIFFEILKIELKKIACKLFTL